MCRRELREQARRCRRLANSIYNPATAAELERYARMLEEQAAGTELQERRLNLGRPASDHGKD